MARRKRVEEHENHERWLVSYADFITLLFAFFVVMYAISSVNEGKYKVLSNSLVDAFKQPNTSANFLRMENQHVMGAPQKLVVIPGPTVLPSAGKYQEQAKKMRGMASDLRKSLGSLIDEGTVKVTQSKRGIAVEISDSILFMTGRADLQSDAISALQTIAAQLQGSDNLIQIEGHTDNQPIRGGLFPSNWELSSARAASVVRLFQESGIAPQRMAAVGYAEFRPVESNDSDESRARNRRVTLNILADNQDEVAVISQN
ncbi:flagellar motor protein MotD [Chitinibacter sp. S2-10]|uniref:flagellar motor protein MotD n=1 Tax=Chitinibacter sp. S2-10 TaxID=3373597 RepID=UPI00397780AD